MLAFASENVVDRYQAFRAAMAAAMFTGLREFHASGQGGDIDLGAVGRALAKASESLEELTRAVRADLG